MREPANHLIQRDPGRSQQLYISAGVAEQGVGRFATANELIVETQHPQAGTVRQTRPAARFERTPAELRRPAPTVGQHTNEILSEAGFSEQEIQALRELEAVS